MSHRVIVALVLVVAALQGFLWSLQPVTGIGTDPWWHAKTGQQIIADGRLPTADAFSFTAADRAPFLHSWLTDVAMGWVEARGGIDGLLWMRGVACALLLVMMVLAGVARSAGWMASLVAGSVAATALPVFLLMRPQLAGYVLFAALLVAQDLWWSGRARGWVLPLIFAAWVNVHGSFILGLGLLVVYVAARSAERTGGPSWRERAVVVAGCLAACLLNPYGWDALLFPLRHAEVAYVTALDEWRPPTWDTPAYRPFFVLTGVWMVLALARRSVLDVAYLATLGWMSLHEARHIPLLAIALAPSLARSFTDLLAWTPLRREIQRWKPMPGRLPASVLLLAVAVGLAVTAARSLPLERLVRWETYPVDAAAILRLNGLRGNVFNSYNWGGYVLAENAPDNRVFIDGRAGLLYPEEVFLAYVDALERGNLAVLQRLGVRVALLSAEDQRYPLAAHLEASGWRKLYSDDLAAVFVAPDVKVDRLVLPDSAFQAFYRGVKLLEDKDDKAAMAAFHAALDKYPCFAAAHANIGFILANADAWDEAAAAWRRALECNPQTPYAHYLLGKYHERQGRPSDARKEYQRELDRDPTLKAALDALQQLEH